MRSAGVALGVVGGLSQLGVTIMGDAIGGMSPVIVLLGLDALVAIAGSALAVRWARPGAALMLAAGLGAVVALLGTTLLEMGVAAFLLLAVAATLRGEAVRR